MPEEAVKPLTFCTDAEIELCRLTLFDAWHGYYLERAEALCAQAKSANSLREQLAVLEAASLTGLMDENAALKAKLAAVVRLAKAKDEFKRTSDAVKTMKYWWGQNQASIHGEEKDNEVIKANDLAHIEKKSAESLCLSLGMGEV